jgi:Fis family transcriptional regulator
VNTAKLKKQKTPPRDQKHKKCLCDCVYDAMQSYFDDLDGHDAKDLYAIFLPEFEKPIFEVVMQHTRGNITKASQILGLNRATLRNRLRKYGLE